MKRFCSPLCIPKISAYFFPRKKVAIHVPTAANALKHLNFKICLCVVWDNSLRIAKRVLQFWIGPTPLSIYSLKTSMGSYFVQVFFSIVRIDHLLVANKVFRVPVAETARRKIPQGKHCKAVAAKPYQTVQLSFNGLKHLKP